MCSGFLPGIAIICIRSLSGSEQSVKPTFKSWQFFRRSSQGATAFKNYNMGRILDFKGSREKLYHPIMLRGGHETCDPKEVGLVCSVHFISTFSKRGQHGNEKNQ